MGGSAAITVGSLFLPGGGGATQAVQQINKTASTEAAQDAAKAALAAADQAETTKENNQATATAIAQAKVRAIANPDADSIMTSPLGSINGRSQNQQEVAQKLYGSTTPGIQPPPNTNGKDKIGG